MVKNVRGFVHLTQDEEHLVVYELFVLFEVTAHVLLQLITDLLETRSYFVILSLVNATLESPDRGSVCKQYGMKSVAGLYVLPLT